MQMANQPPEMQGRYALEETTRFKHLIDQYFSIPETHRHILESIDSREKDIFKRDNGRTLKRVTFDLASIRDFNQNLFQFIVAAPLQAIPLFVEPIEDILVTDVDAAKRLHKTEPDKKQIAKNRQFETKGRSNIEKPKIFINFSGYLGRNFVHPRGLRATLANQLVQVKGIVTRVSTVGQRILQSAHYVENLDIGIVRQYEDKYDFKADLVAQSGFMGVPETDPQGNQMSLEYGFSEYKDIQTAVLQELPENSPIGALPRSVEVLLQNDLVDECKPGDRIRVMGVYKPMSTPATTKNGNFKMILLATGILHQQEQSDIMPDSSEIRHIRNLAKNPEAYDILARSVAPSIQGLENPKKAILLQLLGGEQKMLSTGTHVRGDINILLLGDPSTGKSQLMRNVLKIANRAIATTGRGATGVGLTAAVHINKETNQRVLEAGAMVLADRGVICIDEFDKMNDIDRVAIHEVMEQQTVTIAKAGIHASLNARCSVLAAANPSYGSYIRDMRPSDNINMPDSLLSRFDLLFITLDTPDKKEDFVIANRVIGNHSYRAPRGQRMDVFEKELQAREGYLQPQELYGDKRDTLKQQADKDGVFMKHDPKLHGNKKDLKIVTRSFLKKYISYAKRTHPTLSVEAKEYITEQWNLLRRYYEKLDCNMPVTVRQLETLLRLSAARAKLRLVNEVSQEDAVQAFRLLWISVFNKDPSVETLHAGADGIAPEMQVVKKRGGIKRDTSQKENKRLNSQRGKREKKKEVNKFLYDEGYGDEDEEEEPEETVVNVKKEEVLTVKREKKDTKSKGDYDESIAQEIQDQIHKMKITKGSKNKDQVNRERALFLAAYQYSNKNEIDEIGVDEFFKFLKQHFSENKLVRGKYEVHKYENVEEMVGDLHELDHQGKVLLQSNMNTFTII